MFEVPKNAVVQWRKQQNIERVVPQSIDFTCPLCGRTPINFAFNNWDSYGHYAQIQSRCSGCGGIVRFWLVDPAQEQDKELMAQSRLYIYPAPPLHGQVEEGIAEISPAFVKIYNQALMAEVLSLDELCGMGFRKALEFLIKDNLCRLYPEKQADIKKKLLGPCIEEYVTDPNVKECARRATWLGNDETHYVRRWTDKDIEDLKRLLQLTRYWISMGFLTEKYIADMPKK